MNFHGRGQARHGYDDRPNRSGQRSFQDYEENEGRPSRWEENDVDGIEEIQARGRNLQDYDDDDSYEDRDHRGFSSSEYYDEDDLDSRRDEDEDRYAMDDSEEDESGSRSPRYGRDSRSSPSSRSDY